MRPAGPAPKVQIVPVWRLLRYVKTRLREDPKLQYLGVSGEVSNLKRQPNGTLYFDLKDADGLLNCVAWPRPRSRCRRSRTATRSSRSAR